MYKFASKTFSYIFLFLALLLCGASIYLLFTASGFSLPVILIAAAALFILVAAAMQVHSVKKVRDRFHWYESLLDAIPFPISVTDMDMNWTFINKPVEDMLRIKRSDVLGKQCSNWNANICNTDNCGIARLRSGEIQTQFKQLGRDFQVDTSYLLNAKGNQVGHIEVVQDITSNVRGAQYSNQEVLKIADNLKSLSEGRLKLDFAVTEGDEYTIEERSNFEAINRNFKTAVESISAYITEISIVLDMVVSGDISRLIEADFDGDFVELKTSINQIITSLNGMLSNIHKSAQQVAAGTRQVSDGSQSISQGATEQASAIEELSATITLIAEQTRQNAISANQANGLAIHARSSAANGNEQMKRMQSAMTEINEASSNISKIIRVIDDIAFQTNILALNAAVEAARAGAHGKGFAVVAEEVRNLAARSAKAAQETTALIEGSVKKSEAGTEIANKTAESLIEIVEAVENAATLMGEIAVASDQQATGIAQLNNGIEQLSQVVQNNSATSEETAASAEELSSQAEMLRELVGTFKLGNAEASATNQSTKPKALAAAAKAATPHIQLSDGEFGKY